MTIQPRAARPNRRSIIGGVLVAVAALGTFAASSGALGDERQSVVVAAHDISPGTQLTAADLTTTRAALAPEVARNTISRPQDLIGTRVVAPFRSGEIIQSGSVITGAAAGGQTQLSFALARSRALGGDLRSGETVDVLVTDKTSETQARVAVMDAAVVRVEKGTGSAIGADAEITITLSLPTTTDAAIIAGAIDGGHVTLARSPSQRAFSTAPR